MVDIFDEVDEDIRAERVARFARRYAILLIGVVVLVILGVAGWQVWSWHQGQLNARAGSAYLAVMEQAGQRGSAADRDHLAQSFGAVADSSPQGYATLAKLNQASLLADSGHLKEAEPIWDGLINDGNLNPVLRQVATLGWASHEIDTAEPSLIQARLEGLAADSSPWRPLALQYLALLSIRTGHKDQAIKTLQQVAGDISTPADMRNMANALAQALGAPPPAQ
ncbi:DUF2659 family protein [Acidisoma silvae]|uniref:Tetratricopeptide repeat protein n=1 Tax=Acidisoma silvae TaxID=2802396 RepID=A0A963YP08_9PROT|nr:tetratricopeptide repeat protein [Acidisoma silvae]MCB8874309.1 tetratricopeptide repeat protein [Acidisoma silvae]